MEMCDGAHVRSYHDFILRVLRLQCLSLLVFFIYVLDEISPILLKPVLDFLVLLEFDPYLFVLRLILNARIIS